MNRSITILAVLTFCMISSAKADGSKPWTINSKSIPIPLGASESLQNSLRSTDQPNTELRESQAPKSLDDWDQLIAERAKSRSTPLKQVEEMMNVKIKKDLIDGITVYWITPNKKAEEQNNDCES